MVSENTRSETVSFSERSCQDLASNDNKTPVTYYTCYIYIYIYIIYIYIYTNLTVIISKLNALQKEKSPTSCRKSFITRLVHGGSADISSDWKSRDQIKTCNWFTMSHVVEIIFIQIGVSSFSSLSTYNFYTVNRTLHRNRLPAA